MPNAEQEAMEWLEDAEDPGCEPAYDNLQRRKIKSMLAAKPRPTLPERLYEEDAVAIAETMRREADWKWMDGAAVQALWLTAYAHLSAPPKPPAPKTKTVWVVRASWAKPEARTTEDSYGTWASARDLALDCVRYGAISVSITPEERPA